MAIHSKIVELLKAVAVSVSWSAVALFFDGLFWRFLFLLGDFFIYLGNLMHSFGAIARAPPLPPPDEGGRKSPERPPMGIDAPAPQPQRSTMGMPGDAGYPGHYTPPRPQRSTMGMPGYPRHYTAGVLPDVKCSKPAHEVHDKLPEFLCDEPCHRRWPKWYAIVIGRQPGLYNCWNCAEDMVTELRGNMHKSFKHKLDAETFLRTEWHCLQNHSQ